MWIGVTTFANNRRGWRRGLAAIAALALSASAWAHGPTAPGKIEFLPPPMEGTISLGIYDPAGKLVRVLHREAEISELTAGIDGLITQWDGKDDQGQPCPTGSYRARGVMVGELAVEGIDFIGNDWVTDDDSPRIRRITGLHTAPLRGEPVLTVQIPGRPAPATYGLALKAASKSGDAPEVRLIERDVKKIPPGAENLPDPPPHLFIECIGLNDTKWIIEQGVVKQYSKKGELLRTLAPGPDDPPAVGLAASLQAAMVRGVSAESLQRDPLFGLFANGQQLCVLYENAQLQRLRGYDFTGLKPGAEPRELFENDIRASDRYEQIASQLKFPDGKPFTPAETVTVTLLPNPLLKNKRETLQIRAAVDKDGSYLATVDGLPLCRISESKALLWAVIGQVPGSKVLLLFDSDGAVVEEFQISKPGQMMTFDAGAFQWTAAAPSPAPGASAAPSPSASPDAVPVMPPPVEAVPSPAPPATVQPSASPSATPTPVP